MRIHRPERHQQRFAEPVDVLAPAGGLPKLFLDQGRRHGIGCLPVGNDHAVGNLDDPVGLAGNFRIVGDDNDGVALAVELGQNAHQIGAALLVERTGRLVGEDHVATVHQRPRHADALLLAAREFVRAVEHALAEAESGQQLLRPLAPCRTVRPGINRWHLDVFGGIEIGQQLVALEDEAEILPPQPGDIVRVERRHVLALEAVGAAPFAIEAADDVHQRRLAGAGSANDGDHLSGVDGEVDVLQRGEDFVTGLEDALQPADLDDRPFHLRTPARRRAA